MKHYVGTKLVRAEAMTRGEYNKFRDWEIPNKEDPNDEGYIVWYNDDYYSWSPKGIFEHSHIEVQENPRLTQGVSVGKEMVNDFIKKSIVVTLGNKTTMVRCVLVNGFEIIETASCIDEKNYSMEIGEKICMEKIIDKIWNYLGFLVQTACNGCKHEEEVE